MALTQFRISWRRFSLSTKISLLASGAGLVAVAGVCLAGMWILHGKVESHELRLLLAAGGYRCLLAGCWWLLVSISC